jgi:hypothetical protein
MREQLKHDISAIEREIQVAKESQAKLDKWEVGSIRRDPITDPFVGYTRQILITTTDDLELIQNEIRLAEKYPDNTTIVHMDKNGNYKVVYGLKLDQIPKGDLKVMINAHGALGSIADRSIEEIAKYISTIEQATGEDFSVRKVSLIPFIAINAFYFWLSIFINRKTNIVMLVCIRIHRDYFTFFIERISNTKR